MTTSALQLYSDDKELGRLIRNLGAYIKVFKGSEDEILNKKGNDLRIQLFTVFWSQRWKRGTKGGGFKLLKQLSDSGKGVLVRLMHLVSPWAGKIPATDKHGKPLTMWQKLVAQEMLRRSSGVGVLGVSFLRKRWAYKNQQKYLTENRTRGLGKAVTFEKTEHEFIITGFTPGLARVAQKYGLLSKALSNTSRDIETYLSRKIGPEFVQTLHAT